MLRIERINRGIKAAKKMAEALGITASMLSEIENGKKGEYPDIDFLLQCRDFFGWKIQEAESEDIKLEKIKKTFELFEKGLLSSEYISLNMNNFHGIRKTLLAKIIMVLLFIPDQTPSHIILTETERKWAVDNHIEKVSDCLSGLYNLLQKLGTKDGEINDLPSPPVHKRITRKRSMSRTTKRGE
jgi:transcriptional regulator with XRE-family HTH domain